MIKKELQAFSGNSQTLFIGQYIIELSEINSTNKFAQELLKSKKLPEGSVVTTKCQTKGKGQDNTYWESETGKNITLSIILYPNFLLPKEEFLLNQTISLGVFDLCTHYLGAGVKIKWPNDIYYKDKKIAGILIENTVQGNKMKNTVAGIGININQTNFSKNIPNPASFKQINNKDHTLSDCIDDLCSFLEKRYLQLKAAEYTVLKNDYLNALYRYQQQHTYIYKGNNIQGKITGITNEGKLILECNNQLYHLFPKEIEFVL